jgi:hypothetical protein
MLPKHSITFAWVTNEHTSLITIFPFFIVRFVYGFILILMVDKVDVALLVKHDRESYSSDMALEVRSLRRTVRFLFLDTVFEFRPPSRHSLGHSSTRSADPFHCRATAVHCHHHPHGLSHVLHEAKVRAGFITLRSKKMGPTRSNDGNLVTHFLPRIPPDHDVPSWWILLLLL